MMGEADELGGSFGGSFDELFDRIRSLQQRETKGLVDLEGFERVKGDLPIEVTLELAVLTLVHYRYCGIPQWQVQKTYRFTLEGIFQRTWVEGTEADVSIRLTPEAAIGLARQLSQQDFEEW